MSSSSQVKGWLHKFKTKIACQFPFRKTPKNRVSSAKGVHLAENSPPSDKTEKCTRCVQGIVRYPIKSLDKGWDWNQLLIGLTPPPSFWQ